MRRAAAFAHRTARPAFLAVVALHVAGIAALVAGLDALGTGLISVAWVVGIPLFAVAESRPRAGLLWYGSAAEPWRADRSPGEPAALVPSDR